jgi:predicted metal-binding protein
LNGEGRLDRGAPVAHHRGMTKSTFAQDRRRVGKILAARGLTDYRWIDPEGIAVAELVRMKCRFGCDGYGKGACCPPNVPSVAECRAFFAEYELGAVLRFEKRLADKGERRKWSVEQTRGLLALERDAFLAGYERAFMLVFATCHLCAKCATTRAECAQPALARPTPEAFAVDVFSTVHRIGYPIEVTTSLDDVQNRYAILLVR